MGTETENTEEEIIDNQDVVEETITDTGEPEEATESEEAANDEDISEEQEQLIILKEDLTELEDNLLRERADFSNFRKRTLQEKADLQVMVAGNILHELLPGLDSFDQLFASSQEGSEELNQFFDGVKMIQKQILGALEKFGLQELSPENEEFDPNTMEALNVKESEEVDMEKVEQVYQKGYRINEKVIRAARVSVLKPAEKKEGSQEATENEKQEKEV